MNILLEGESRAELSAGAGSAILTGQLPAGRRGAERSGAERGGPA